VCCETVGDYRRFFSVLSASLVASTLPNLGQKRLGGEQRFNVKMRLLLEAGANDRGEGE
jgi:hypothetical protein